MSLYLSEAEIAREILGTKRAHEWRALADILERDGFPKVDPIFGGRYMPAVRAWLDAYNRIGNIAPVRRGRETWQDKPKPQGSSGERAKAANVYPIGSRDPT